MDAMQGTSPALAQGVIKDATGAQLISKTLDRINAVQGMGGAAVDTSQFQKDVLHAAGIGTMLDRMV